MSIEKAESLAVESARHWRMLAAQERERLTWDKTCLPAIAEARATTYENAARAIELGEETGVAHCACHLITMKACSERAASRRKP